MKSEHFSCLLTLYIKAFGRFSHLHSFSPSNGKMYFNQAILESSYCPFSVVKKGKKRQTIPKYWSKSHTSAMLRNISNFNFLWKPQEFWQFAFDGVFFLIFPREISMLKLFRALFCACENFANKMHTLTRWDYDWILLWSVSLSSQMMRQSSSVIPLFIFTEIVWRFCKKKEDFSSFVHPAPKK